ncbi:sensor histidine kinase [Aeromonas simiae]|uniref:sensor histidine kinase n=1 Tax=Aeromonas simiae TaxID=218936 RepID=UPI00266CF3F2|nr:HAMP domain-containing sensor histidine kinase [Aeromonas simiae]MDO2948719.1 HAMP domain-containing histidine kinase [Aeromonas simiae]MDO2952194.1 HAMP domain-containing histidine kinase [Aeromonas simiae]MDO2956102.1 HAMP domain-containing histidine kinase [Aeromonas simiae]
MSLPSLRRHLILALGGAGLLFLLLTTGLMMVAEDKMEELSLRHWLEAETLRYDDDWRRLGEAAPAPNPRQFSSYWSEAGRMPPWLTRYAKPGFYEHELGDEDKHFLVAHHPSGQGLLYLVFNDDADDYLDPYEETLHTTTRLIGVGMLLAALGFGFWLVRHITRPLERLRQRVAHLTPEQADFTPDAPWQELREIELALLSGKREVAAVFAREREFSRFASHELRTPNMVIQGSAALLDKIAELPPPARRAVARIRAGADEMALLTETFLLLGRSGEIERPAQEVALLIQAELSRLQPLLSREAITVQLTLDQSQLHAPLSLLTIAIDNLLKNALSYAEGRIEVQLKEGVLTVRNPTQVAPDTVLGYGCGLTIIERICEKLGWHIETRLEAGLFTARLDGRS